VIQDTNYSIGDATFAIAYTDITAVSAGALVSSDDNYLSMGGGVSAAIADAAGGALLADARKHIPLHLGDVIVTTAGRLSAKYVFHGITIDMRDSLYADADTVRKITRRCLELAEALGIQALAFPALGTGSAGVPSEPCAEAMTREIAAFLSARTSALRQVTLVLYGLGGPDMKRIQSFYATSAGLAVQWTGSRRLGALVNELVSLLPCDDSNVALRNDLRRLTANIASAEVSLDRPALSTQAVAQWEQSAGLAELSKSAQNALERSQEVIDWEDVKAQEKILNARLESLRTQHNVMYANRNRLEEQKSNYAPAEVPLFMLNALDGVAADIERVQVEIAAVKTQQAALARRSEHDA
jgi:O-acetyl-ADP-ribose deacetylase (regulator of RNase III)